MPGERADDVLIDALVCGLERHGWSAVRGVLGDGLVAALLRDAIDPEQAGALAQAGVGQHLCAADVRSVQARWLDGESLPERAFLDFAEALRIRINRQLYLGLFEFEAQFLNYPPGGFYKRHVDSLRGARNRVVSLVAYLNRGWREEDGGALAVWQTDGEGERRIEVLPEAGTVVLMLSEEIPHEALPATVPRRAIAGWYRVSSGQAGLR